MPEINISTPINKIICYAIGCNQNAETNLHLIVERQEISLFFCNSCLDKFKKFNENKYEK